MIPLNRGVEPAELAAIRPIQLAHLRQLGREPISKEIDGYQCASETLWRGQNLKCCYCEQKIPEKYNDVEHYRPKAAADRRPGCTLSHGYWWLAFNWDNLLFACPACNRSSKNTKFPLDVGSKGVIAESTNFDSERPLLIDPYHTNPVEHIAFTQKKVLNIPIRWYATSRDNSKLGHYTIKTCDLNRQELIELRQDHFEVNLVGPVSDFLDSLKISDVAKVRLEFSKLKRLVGRRNHFSAFNYDVFRELIPDTQIRGILGHGWPLPADL